MQTDGKARNELERQVGRLLETTRESRGLSLDEAQRATTIHAHQLKALERGHLEELETLHGPVWTRSFLTRYAKMLGLDGEALAEQVLPLERPSLRQGFFWRHRRGVLAGVLGLGMLAVLAIAATVIVSSQPSSGENPQRTTLIFDAGDMEDMSGVMVAKFAKDDPGLLLIPGNTLVELPGHETGEVAAALALGGPDLVRKSMAQLTAVKIPYYAVIDANGVKEIVDIMGGIQVDVPSPVSGRASVGGSLITVPAGSQTLNGDQVLVYLQGGDLSGDAERIERQQAFLEQMFHQAFRTRNIISHPITVYKAVESIETNMTKVEAIRFAGRVRSMLDESNASMQVKTIPGHKEVTALSTDGTQSSYWVLNAQQLPGVLNTTVQ